MKSLRLTTVRVAAVAAMVPAFAMAQAQTRAQVAKTSVVPSIPDSTTPADTMKSVLTKKPLSSFYNTAPRI
jgi:histidinol-phosphate/aromatic aminotransferase/cobyric acid decarboxylase-like protein